MARLKGGVLKGQVGGIVYSEWNGIEVLRSLPRRSKNGWSDKQLLHRQRFAAINAYCGKYRYSLIPMIWNPAAANGHGYNLFLKANSSAFALDGSLAEVEKLHFSAGKLPLPRQFKAKRAVGDPSKVETAWVNDENLSTFYSQDELMMVAFYPDHFSAPMATGILRKSAEALIELPEESENISGLWLFFRSSRMDGYSGDEYFPI